MKLWEVGKRWMITDLDRKPKSATEAEYGRCQILGDYPTREAALAGARLTIEKRKAAKERYARLHGHPDRPTHPADRSGQ